MKRPDPAALAALEKATVSDPIVAGNASRADTAGSAGSAGNAGNSVRKLTIRLDDELLGRIRAAYLRQLAAGGEHRSLSAWTAAQLEAAVLADEAAFNGGHTYSPVDAGILPAGPVSHTR